MQHLEVSGAERYIYIYIYICIYIYVIRRLKVNTVLSTPDDGRKGRPKQVE